MRCDVNLVVFECGAVQPADKVCGHSAACGCIFCYPRHLYFGYSDAVASGGKLILQKVAKSGVDWDDALSDEV